jgi:hypothetical protein
MNLGAPELIILLMILVVGVVSFGLTIWGAIDASKRGQTGWLIGMVIGFVFGVGWVVALVYLLAIRPSLVAEDPPSPYPYT